MTMLSLVPEMTLRVTTVEPLTPTTGSPSGPRQYWQVSEAELVGDRIRASLAATGSDYMRMTGDGYYRPHVRLQVVTDDGAPVLVEYTGLVEQTDALARAAEDDTETDWADHYIRLSIRFDTGAEKYSWLNTNLFVAAGRITGTGKLEYAIHRVA
jgi:hypothetical protein